MHEQTGLVDPFSAKLALVFSEFPFQSVAPFQKKKEEKISSSYAQYSMVLFSLTQPTEVNALMTDASLQVMGFWMSGV